MVTCCLVGSILTFYLIPKCKSMFLKANISGRDMGKKNNSGNPTKIPEAQGVITGCVFLMITYSMIPLWYLNSKTNEPFPHAEFYQLLAALSSITFMLCLGFVDDVLDLRWRHKLILPTIASLPLLTVYGITSHRTDVVVPLFLRSLFGTNIDLGILYYIYMGMLAVFCTNAINILAGINGLEVGQSIIIALSIMIFNWINWYGFLGAYHKFSLYFLCPYVSTSLPLLWYNWYPSAVFSGDTFCYFRYIYAMFIIFLLSESETIN